MKQFLFALLTLAFALSIAKSGYAQAWQKPIQPSSSAELITVARSAGNPERLFVASQDEIFERSSEDSWRKLWNLEGQNYKIHQLKSFSSHPYSLFVLSNRGLFVGNLLTQTWSRAFFGNTPRENNTLSFSVHPETETFFVLGTESGLFFSTDAGKSWKFASSFGRTPVSGIILLPHSIIITTAKFIFLTDDLIDFKIVYSFDGELEKSDDESVASDSFFTNQFATDSFHKTIWVTSQDGVHVSRDSGQTWQAMSQSGLQNKSILDIDYVPLAEKLYAATPSGVYVYDSFSHVWRELYQGLDSGQVIKIQPISSPHPLLTAVTSSGFFEYNLGLEPSFSEQPWINSPKHLSLFHTLIRLEPSPQEVHSEVIYYNDVGQQKIRRWQRSSRLQALLPNISFGRDYSESNNVDLDRGSTSVADEYIIGPQDINRGWDFDVSWDLGDLIWSSSQTSIDSRSKSVVDLRRELLSEASRIYHERRRLQMSVVYQPPSSEHQFFEQLIRMDELTSLLDGLTGGFFSRKLVTIYQNHPELESLWQYYRSSAA